MARELIPLALSLLFMQSDAPVTTLAGEDGPIGVQGVTGDTGAGLPASCADGEIAKRSPSGFVCAGDAANDSTGTVSSVIAASPLTGSASAGTAELSLRTDCATGQLLKSTGASYACADDDTEFLPTGAIVANNASVLVSFTNLATSGGSNGVTAQVSHASSPGMSVIAQAAGARAIRVEGRSGGGTLPVVIEDSANQRARLAMYQQSNANRRWIMQAELTGAPELRVIYRDAADPGTEGLRVQSNGTVRVNKLQVGSVPFDATGGAHIAHGGLTLAFRAAVGRTCTGICQAQGFKDCMLSSRRVDDTTGAVTDVACGTAAATGAFVLCPCFY